MIRAARPLEAPVDRSMAYLELAVTAVALLAAGVLFLIR
jgi:hypothetical protein